MKNKLHLILILALVWAFIPATSARAEAQFVERIGSANPLDDVSVGVTNNLAPAFADLDYDGDLDAFIGKYDGSIDYYRNAGTRYNPSFTKDDANNPFNGVDVGSNSAPTFVDIDHDGDLDAFIGESDGTINFYYNIGNLVTPNFMLLTGSSNPFDGENVGANSKPFFFDYNLDGDMDAFVGSSDGKIYWFRNDGNATIWNYTAIIPALADTHGATIDVGSNCAPAFMDLDGDGDMDLLSGKSNGNILYYENTADAEVLGLEERTGAANPLAGKIYWMSSTPELVDIDGDGDLDAFVGDQQLGSINYYENIGDNTEVPSMQEQASGNNPLYGVDVGANSAPAFVDIDADGDMDAFSGANDGTIRYHKNAGHATHPTFSEQIGTANPFNGVDVEYVSRPSFVDIEGDGDMDAVIGSTYGKLFYFENIGDAVGPNFVERTGDDNPFNAYNGYEEEDWSSPAFANYIDGYKGLEAFVGFKDGGIRSFVNTTFPALSYSGYSAPPLTTVDVGFYSAPAFCDLHSDGQIDTYIGENTGTIVYYKAFGNQLGGYNPFDGVDVGFNATPAFVDIDADGDYDAFVGNLNGTFYFFENFSMNEKIYLPLVVR